MKVLIVGAGVIGTVYGAHLAAAGNTVWVLSHGVRTDEVAAGGLSARIVVVEAIVPGQRDAGPGVGVRCRTFVSYRRQHGLMTSRFTRVTKCGGCHTVDGYGACVIPRCHGECAEG